AQALASASIVDLDIYAAPVLIGETTGPRASTPKTPATRLSDNSTTRPPRPRRLAAVSYKNLTLPTITWKC
ncbi:hypothetical protein, partial [Enterobacter asburiae]